MLTAIINARCTSSRLPFKHFKKIENRTVIEIILDELLKNKLIKEIYIATGPYKKNKRFKHELEKKYVNLKFFFYNNEDNVTERIFFLSKKIKTDYSLLISGDCIMIDNFYIKRLYQSLMKAKNFEFIKSTKKLQHEGIKLFKTKAWKKVYENSKLKIFQENPGYITAKKPHLFKIFKFKPEIYEIGKSSRLSIDTQSDLDFFETIYKFLKLKKKKFNLQNTIKYDCLNKFKFINSHVKQKKPNETDEKKIFIVTCCNPKFGLGHYSRSKILEREIIERFTSKVNTIFIDSKKISINENDIYLSLNNFINLNINNKNEVYIFDLPNEILIKISVFLKRIKNLIVIDQIIKLKKAIKIIPAVSVKSDINQKIYSGKNFIFLNREINKINALKKYNNFLKENFIVIGGTFFQNDELEELLSKGKKMNLVLGAYINKSQIKYYKKFKPKKIIFNPYNYLHLISNSKKIFCKFGISVFEIIALGIKPYIFIQNEKGDRMREIKWLNKNNFANTKNYTTRHKKNINFNINKNLDKISNLLKKKIYE